MWFVHRAQVDSEVLVLHALDVQRDVSGPVAQLVAAAALLVLLVLDVVTQQLPAGVLPLDRELVLLPLVLEAVEAPQVHHVAWERLQDRSAAWKHQVSSFLASQCDLVVYN